MINNKVLVFGATGRVGAELIKALPSDVPIKAACRRQDATDFPDNVEGIPFDFNDPPADLGPLFAGVDRMFLLWPPRTTVNGALAPIIQAAAACGVEQVVFLSILGADKLNRDLDSQLTAGQYETCGFENSTPTVIPSRSVRPEPAEGGNLVATYVEIPPSGRNDSSWPLTPRDAQARQPF